MRHLGSVVVVAASLGISSPVFSDELSGYALDILRLADNQDHQTQSVSRPLVKNVAAGDVKLVLEATTLAELQQRFGGAIQSQGGAGSSLSWICYSMVGTPSPVTVWFLSSELGGTDKAVTGLVLKSTDQIEARCETAPSSLSTISLDAPAIGDAEDAVLTKFGLSRTALGSDVVLDNTSLPNKDGFSTLQTLFYRLQNGKIDGLAFFQISTN